MSRFAVVTVSALVAAAVLAVVVWRFDWPAWAAFLATVAVVGAYLAALAWSRPEPEPEPRALPVAAPAPAAPPPPPSVTLQQVPLPTADRDYRFLLYATVSWRVRPGGGPGQPAHPDAVATRMVVAKASELTASEPPDRWDLVEHKLNRALGVPMTDPTGSLDVWAHHVGLTLPQDDYERQRQMAALRKDVQMWEHQRNYERNVRAYLHNEALATTGSAVVWWLSHEPRKIEETAELIGTLARLTAAANDREVDPVFRSLLAGGTSVPDGVEPGGVDSGGVDPGGAANGAGLGTSNGAANGAVLDGLPSFDAGGARLGVPGDPRDVAAANVRRLADSLVGIGDKPERVRLGDQLARVVADYDDELARRIRGDFDAPDLDDPGLDDPPLAGGEDAGPGPDDADGSAEVGRSGAWSAPTAGRHMMPGADPYA